MAKFIAIGSSLGLGAIGLFLSLVLMLTNFNGIALTLCLGSIYLLGLGFYLSKNNQDHEDYEQKLKALQSNYAEERKARKDLEQKLYDLEKSIKQIIPPPENELSTERAGEMPALSSFFSLLVGI